MALSPLNVLRHDAFDNTLKHVLARLR